MSRRGWYRRSLKVLHEIAAIGVGGASTRQAELAAAAADPSLLASLLRSERNKLLLLGIGVANAVLAVWRPKLMVKIR